MGAQHTPGPWRVEVRKGVPMDTVFIMAGRDRVIAYRLASYGDSTKANFEHVVACVNRCSEPVESLAREMANAMCGPGEDLWAFLCASEREHWLRAAAIFKAARQVPA